MLVEIRYVLKRCRGAAAVPLSAVTKVLPAPEATNAIKLIGSMNRNVVEQAELPRRDFTCCRLSASYDFRARIEHADLSRVVCFDLKRAICAASFTYFSAQLPIAVNVNAVCRI